MHKIAYFGLLCASVLVGCSKASPPPTEEKVQELNAAMDADMKAMTQQIPKTPVPAK